jgi:flagellar hook-associated protein 3 FlgL
MRVTTRSLYDHFLSTVGQTQSKLAALNEHSATQKRINRPSDDPVDTARVLAYRDSLASIAQYQKNIEIAKGWLGLADEATMQVSSILSNLQSLAEQGATGTLTAKDRAAASYEARQLFQQLVGLANSRYEGKSIFAGHRVEEAAYVPGAMVLDSSGQVVARADGSPPATILVQFVGPQGTQATVGTTNPITYRYTTDGGKSWTTKTLDATWPHDLELDGVTVHLENGYTVDLSPVTNTKTSQGTWLTVATAAVYQGDVEEEAAITYAAKPLAAAALQVDALPGLAQDVRLQVLGGSMGGTVTYRYSLDGGATWSPTQQADTGLSPILWTQGGAVRLRAPSGTVLTGVDLTAHAGSTVVDTQGTAVNARSVGNFQQNLMVRVDNTPNINLGAGGTISYAYSLDGGRSWSTGHSAPNSIVPTQPAVLTVPGGELVLTSGPNGEVSLPSGAMFVVRPATAHHEVDIATGGAVRLNDVGMEIFGGIFAFGATTDSAHANRSSNILVAAAKLVAALETNDQQGCGRAVEAIRDARSALSVSMASIGARENRLEVASTVLSGLKLDETERLSRVEDVDVAELMTKLASQQMIYETVLKSASYILRQSLANYL